MTPFFQRSDADATESWLLQGNLGWGRWRRWFRVATTGDVGEDSANDDSTPPEREDLARVLEIVRERRYGKQAKKFTVAKDESNFVPLSFLEIGTTRSQAVCRIARYFSLDTFDKLIDSIQASPRKNEYNSESLLTEIFTIPEQVANEIFKPGVEPLAALKELNESQLAKLNPIPIGTGFLVGGTHLMTNHHVIADEFEAAECVAQFNYVKDTVGGAQHTIDYEFDPTVLFVTNPDLDYTLVQLKSGMFTRQAGYMFGWLQLLSDDTRIAPGLTGDNAKQLTKGSNSIPGDRVFVVQHPKGQQKQIAQNDNRVLDYEKDGLLKYFLRYSAVSDYGSSGSPVFNSSWDLVALHHAAIAKADTSPSDSTATPNNTNTSTDTPASSTATQSKTVEIEAYQGVRICRIVEDLQAKSWAMPKLKSFIEDFVVTTEQFTYPPLPSALNFNGNNNKYVSLDHAIGLLTASTDGTIKLWNRGGLELKTLDLKRKDVKNAAIDQICFSADGFFVAIARSPQDNQRSQIELWNIKGETLQEIQATLNTTFTSAHPMRNATAQMGDLHFCEAFYNEGQAIAALSTDGYIDIWKLDGTLIKTIDILQQDSALLPSVEELQQEIDRLTEEIDKDQKDLPRWTNGWHLQERIANNKKLLALRQEDLQQKQGVAGTPRYSIAVPILRYYHQTSSPTSVLIYAGRNSIFILDSLNGNPRQVKVSDFYDFCLNPDGTILTVIGSQDITFWNLDGTPKKASSGDEKWLPAGSGQVISYSPNGHSFTAVGRDDILFWEDVTGDATRRSYPAYFVLDADTKNSLGQMQIRHCEFSADGQMFLGLLNDGKIHFFRCKDWGFELLKTLFHDGAISALICPTAGNINTSTTPKTLFSLNQNPFSFVEREAYTLEMWVKPNTAATGPILAKGSRVGTEYAVCIDNGRIVVDIGMQRIDGGKFGSNTFLHIAVVTSKNATPAPETVIYMNGKLVTPEVGYGQYDVAPPSPFALAQTPLLIGGSLASPYPSGTWTMDQSILSNVSSFAGIISEVRIWNVALTEKQITENQNLRLPRETKDQGLIGYWRFEETQDRQIDNLVGDGDCGIIVNAEILPQTDVPHRFTSSLEFRQPGSYVNCGNNPSLDTPTAITVEAWVRNSFGNGFIVNRNEGKKPGYALVWKDNKIRVTLQSQSPAAKTVVDTLDNAPNDRAYHHIAFTWNQDSKEIQVYIDGRRQETVSVEGEYETTLIDGQYRSTGIFTQSLNDITAPFYIGPSSSDQECNWVIAEVRLWKVARTQNQIQFMMAKHLTQNEPGLVGYWRLDDGGETNQIARNLVAYRRSLTDRQYLDKKYHGEVKKAVWFPSRSVPVKPSSGGGSNPPSGGSNPSIGGSNPSIGGSNPPSGGSNPPSGGSNPSIGGSNPPSGGSNPSIGGSGESEQGLSGKSNEAPLSISADIQTHWAKDFITSLMTQKLMSALPDGSFKPDDRATVSDYATLIAKAFDLPLKLDTIAFSDILPDHPAYADIQKAYQMGFLLRSKDNAIDLERDLTRIEVMTCLVNGLGLKGGTINLLSRYSDRKEIPPKIQTTIATALRKGLVVNSPQLNRLEPKRAITRAELATLIYQSRVIQGKAEAIASPYLTSLSASIPLFTDIPQMPPQKYWAADFIQGMVDLGLVDGFQDGSFQPDIGMKRADYAALLIKAFNPKSRSDRLNINIAQPQLFTDVPANSAYFDSIQQIYRSGAMSGVESNRFGAESPIRRDHAISSLVSILSLPDGKLETLNLYDDRATIPTWVQKHIAAATEAGLVVGYNYVTSHQVRATQSASRAEVVAMIYQGLVKKGVVKAIASPYIVVSP